MATTRGKLRDRKKAAARRPSSSSKTVTVADPPEDGFVYTNPFGHREDTTKYRLVAGENLRYSQTAALTMYDEGNTGSNLPAHGGDLGDRRR